MRVAIASAYDKENYGSMLQAFATQRYLETLGIDATTLDKTGLAAGIAVGRRRYYRENVFNLSLYRAKAGFVFHRLRAILLPSFSAKMRMRHAAFRAFSDAHFRLSPRATSFRQLTAYCEQFDAVIVGSDQLWLPVNIAGGYFTLGFVPKGVRTVAYATSFGVSQLPDSYDDKAREFLAKIDTISVREHTGKRIIEDVIDKPVEVVCDPTMLLTPDQWQSVEDVSVDTPDGPYVFCYFLGRNAWNRECARKLAEATGCKVVALLHLDEYVALDDSYADFTPFDVGPGGFLGLIRNASYVCTDSFHGTVFSVLFERPFFSFRRHEGLGRQSTNSRIDSLLQQLELTGRIIDNPAQFDVQTADAIDFELVRPRVVAFRSHSARFLDDALGLGAR